MTHGDENVATAVDTAVLRQEITAATQTLAGMFFKKLPLPVSEMSVAQQLALWPHTVQGEFVGNLPHDLLARFKRDWKFWGRPKQLPPAGDWTYWLLLAGRGFGKTRAIAEWANEKARLLPGSRGAIVAATAADARDVLVEGASGILACADPDFQPVYETSKRRLTWPNGSTATVFSAEQPDRLRGPQFHWAIADELAAWRYMEAFDMLQFGLRLGDNPQCAIATTPRPLPIIKELIADDTCVVVHGTTYENRENLARAFFKNVLKRYEGTRLGQQELMAQILDDTPGALWDRGMLEGTRAKSFPELFRIAIAVDPAASSGQTGILVVGVARIINPKTGELETHGFVLDDVSTEPGALPAVWGSAAVTAYNKWNADIMVGEINHGGTMVEHVIRTMGGQDVNYVTVHASHGKYARAEPVSAIFQQHRGHMVGYFGPLEDELCSWVPGEESPNRLDAMVWGFTALMIDSQKQRRQASGKAQVVSRNSLGL